MKILSLFIFSSLFSSGAFSEPAELIANSHDDYRVGLSYLHWTEQINLQSGGSRSEDIGNFSGYQLSVESEISSSTWGGALGLTLGQGKAAAGGNSSTLSYQSGRQSWMSFGALGKAYYKLNGRVYVGMLMPFFLRRVQWPTGADGTSATGAGNLNAGLLFEINLRITRKMDFYQALGPFSASDGATLLLWGLAYRY